jgi:hypothetical protein
VQHKRPEQKIAAFYFCDLFFIYAPLCIQITKAKEVIAIKTTSIYLLSLYKLFHALRQIKIDLQLSQQTISLFSSKSYMSIDVDDLPHTDLTLTNVLIIYSHNSHVLF